MVMRLGHEWQRHMMAFVIVCIVVFLACISGIMTRPMGFLAAFWPANAVLLGVMVRWPSMACLGGWFGAVAGYLGADLLSGHSLALTVWLTAANLSGAVAGTLMFRRLSYEDMQLKDPLSVLYIFFILCCSSAVTALVGAGAAPVFFGRDIVSGLAFWFTAELVNAIIVLPVILTAHAGWADCLSRRGGDEERVRLLAPLVALVLSLGIGLWVGGAGAIAFPSPALLWCALSLPVFPTVMLTMLVSIWHLIAITLGIFAYNQGIDGATMSDRLGIMLLALGPLTVASTNAARTALLRQLERQVSHDALTGALSRATFLARAEIKLGHKGHPVAVLMMDLDNFKQINDRHGHAVGDRVLVAFASAIRCQLRDKDIFGRIGGEEFAAVLPDVPPHLAQNISERLRHAVEAVVLTLEGQETLNFTVSIGVACFENEADGVIHLDRMLATADKALYRAKQNGRNQVASCLM